MSVSFDGVNDALRLISAPISTSGPATIACWIHPTQETTRNSLFGVNDDTAAQTNFFNLQWMGDDAGTDSRVATVIGDGGSETAQVSTTAVGANQWHHVGGIFTSSGGNYTQKVYLNGTLEGTRTDALSTPTLDRILIGAHHDGSSFADFFQGRMAECVIWNQDVGDANMALLGQGVHPLLVQPDDIVFRAPLRSASALFDLDTYVAILDVGGSAVSDGVDHAPLTVLPSTPVIEHTSVAKSDVDTGSITLSSILCSGDPNSVLIISACQERGSWGLPGEVPTAVFDPGGTDTPMVVHESVSIGGDGCSASLAVYFLVAPPEGTWSVTVTFVNSNAKGAVGGLSCWNSEQTTPLADTGVTQSLNNAPDVSGVVPSDPTHTVLDFLARRRAADPATPGASQTQLFGTQTAGGGPNTNIHHYASSKPGATSVTMSWDWVGTTGRDTAYYVTDLRPFVSTGPDTVDHDPAVVSLGVPSVNVKRQIAHDSAVVSLDVPQPEYSATAKPSPAVVSLDVPAPSLDVGVTHDPAVVELDVPAPQLKVGIGGSAPAVVSLDVPSVAVDVKIAHDPAVVSLDTPAPALSFQVGHDPAVVSLDVPAPNYTSVVKPASAVVSLDVPAPTVGMGVSHDPAVLSLDVPSVAVYRVIGHTPAVVSLDVPAPAVSKEILAPDPAVVSLGVPALSNIATGGPFIAYPESAVVSLGVPAPNVKRVMTHDPAVVSLDVPAVTASFSVPHDPAVVSLDVPAPAMAFDVPHSPAVLSLDVPALAIAFDVPHTPAVLSLGVPQPAILHAILHDPAVVSLDVPSVAIDTPLTVLHDAAIVNLTVPEPTILDASTLGFYSSTSKAVRTSVRTGWAVPQSVAVRYENLPFNKPNGTIWADASVSFTLQPETVGISTSSFDLIAFGELEITIYAPLVIGEKAALDEADYLFSYFENMTVSGVTYESPTVERRGVRGPAWEVVFRCPFWAQDTSTKSAAVTPEALGDREDVASALRSRFRTSVQVPESVAVQYENLPHDDPNAAEVIRVFVVEGGSFIAEQGDTHRAAGVLQAEISVPVGTGESRLFELVDAVDDGFRNINIEGVEVLEPGVSAGRQEGSEWRRNVVCPWNADLVT